MDEEFLKELFQSVGPINVRRIFGGQGIYVDGKIIAAVQAGRLMVKGDDETTPQYQAAGMERWTYVHAKTGKKTQMPYWIVPESALDEPEEMAVWARLALEAGHRAA